MDRRHFLITGAALPLATALPRAARAQHLPFDPQPGGWRTFEITTRVEVLAPAGATRVWLPVPVVADGSQQPLDSSWTGDAATMRIVHDGKHGAAIFYAEWPTPPAAPTVTLSSRFMTRDRAANLVRPDPSIRLDPADAKFYTAPTELQPTDGIVRRTALEITRGARTELARSRAIYEWIVDNTERDPKTRGCGVGDIKAMLETGNLSGKCADLNALYVGLARAAGLPARDVYGIRVAKSAHGYKSLGAGTENITKAQHCRAEVFLTGHGWVPVDPADVRKVILEEPPGNLPMGDEKVVKARERLFGSWEMNWLAYNFAHDVDLPGATKGKVAFLMYPQCETAEGRLDCLDPDNFKYQITAREI